MLSAKCPLLLFDSCVVSCSWKLLSNLHKLVRFKYHHSHREPPERRSDYQKCIACVHHVASDSHKLRGCTPATKF
eukprot:s1508_g9.t1